MDNIKTLYKFTVNLDREVEKIEKKNDGGQDYEVRRKVKEAVPFEIALKKPSSMELKEIRLHYGIAYNDMITKGFLTKGMLVNKYANNTGGVFSQTEAKELYELFKKQEGLRGDLHQMSAVGGDEEAKANIISRLAGITRQIFEIENSNNALFRHSAENKADESTIQYLLYFFSYVKRNDKFEPLFEGNKFEEKEAAYFKLEDALDELIVKSRDRLLNLFGAYYYEMAETADEFAKFEQDVRERLDGPSEPAKVEAPSEAPAQVAKE